MQLSCKSFPTQRNVRDMISMAMPLIITLGSAWWASFKRSNLEQFQSPKCFKPALKSPFLFPVSASKRSRIPRSLICHHHQLSEQNSNSGSNLAAAATAEKMSNNSWIVLLCQQAKRGQQHLRKRVSQNRTGFRDNRDVCGAPFYHQLLLTRYIQWNLAGGPVFWQLYSLSC